MSWLGDVGGGLVSSAFNSWSASKAASKAYGRQVVVVVVGFVVVVVASVVVVVVAVGAIL